MADLSIGRGAGLRPGAAARPAAALERLTAFLAGLADGWRAWRRYQDLRLMGRAELASLGLGRGDIARHAVFGAADSGRPDPTVSSRLSYEAVEHELKTPLTSIRSLAEILLDYPEIGESERRRFLGVLVQENERLGRAVERLLGDSGLRRALG